MTLGQTYNYIHAEASQYGGMLQQSELQVSTASPLMVVISSCVHKYLHHTL